MFDIFLLLWNIDYFNCLISAHIVIRNILYSILKNAQYIFNSFTEYFVQILYNLQFISISEIANGFVYYLVF